MNNKLIKAIAYAGMGLGFLGTIISNYANEKTQEAVINKKVEEELNKRFKES